MAKRKKKRKPKPKAEPPPEEVDAPEPDAEDDEAPEPMSTRRAAAPPSKPRPGGRPWWLFGAIAAVVAIVAYQRMSATEDDFDPTSEVPIDAPPSGPEELRVTVHERYPHDTDAFTQGLLWHDGHLYESTGLRGESDLRISDLRSGRVLQTRSNEDRFFAEGLARVGEELFQLTWQAGEAHVWSVNNFDHQRVLDYDGEGWGLCYDGRFLVMSDGSERLTFRDPVSFDIDHVVRVMGEHGPQRNLNELECVDGVVYANVWQTDRIVRIDPTSGRITANIDASGLLSRVERWEADVLNGIAYLPESERFLLTGKHWPWVFEVEFVPVEDDDEE